METACNLFTVAAVVVSIVVDFGAAHSVFAKRGNRQHS